MAGGKSNDPFGGEISDLSFFFRPVFPSVPPYTLLPTPSMSPMSFDIEGIKLHLQSPAKEEKEKKDKAPLCSLVAKFEPRSIALT